MTRRQISDNELEVAVNAPCQSGTAVIGAVGTKGRILGFRVVLVHLVNAESEIVMISRRKLGDAMYEDLAKWAA